MGTLGISGDIFLIITSGAEWRWAIGIECVKARHVAKHPTRHGKPSSHLQQRIIRSKTSIALRVRVSVLDQREKLPFKLAFSERKKKILYFLSPKASILTLLKYQYHERNTSDPLVYNIDGVHECSYHSLLGGILHVMICMQIYYFQTYGKFISLESTWGSNNQQNNNNNNNNINL